MPQRQRLLEDWNSYMAAVFPNGRPHPIQLQETRRAFYAGALAIFSRMIKDLAPGSGSEPQKADLMMMDDFQSELEDFHKKIASGQT